MLLNKKYKKTETKQKEKKTGKLFYCYRNKMVFGFGFFDNGMSTFVGYLMTNPSLLKNSSDTI